MQATTNWQRLCAQTARARSCQHTCRLTQELQNKSLSTADANSQTESQKCTPFDVRPLHLQRPGIHQTHSQRSPVLDTHPFDAPLLHLQRPGAHVQAAAHNSDNQANAGKEAVEGSFPADDPAPGVHCLGAVLQAAPEQGQSLSAPMSTHKSKPLPSPQQTKVSSECTALLKLIALIGNADLFAQSNSHFCLESCLLFYIQRLQV